MAKLHWLSSNTLLFHCPGCKSSHYVMVNLGSGGWSWNNSMEMPTFMPSVHVFKDDPTRQCHLYINSGIIQFLPACHHELAGKFVPIPDWE